MSRIGKKTITVPSAVEVILEEGRTVMLKGPKGQLRVAFPGGFAVKQESAKLIVEPRAGQSAGNAALWGTTRMLIANAIKGVHEGYETVLELEGVGYRATIDGSSVVLSLGFSHPVRFSPPEGVVFAVDKNTITISGFDKHLVGQIAAAIRAVKKPEPYKGKGIRYRGETIRRKSGKKATGAK